jgi:lysophospholipase L1-like esterase
MKQVLVYGDSLTWGIIPGTRQRLQHFERWPGILEAELMRKGVPVRIVEDCLNGRRTVWEDPFKAGRNGIAGLEQRIEVNSPLALVIVMLGTNDLQSVHQYTAWHSSQGIASIVRAIRRAPIEPGMPVPPILIIAPPRPNLPTGTMAEKFEHAPDKATGMSRAYRAVAAELDCAFFDADEVIATSPIDGVHLDADQHAKLGREIVSAVEKLL